MYTPCTPAHNKPPQKLLLYTQHTSVKSAFSVDFTLVLQENHQIADRHEHL